MNKKQREREIYRLKSLARVQYQLWKDLAAPYEMAGIALSEYLKPDIIEAKQKFNRTMDELAKIDPTTPSKRL